MKRLFCLLISILSVISCQLNPFVGVGTEADTIAPVLKISSHENFQYVNGKLLYLYGTCSDNQKVTSVSLRAEYDGETLFTWEIKNPVSPWSYSIQLDPLADVKKQVADGVAGCDFRLADGQYKFTVFAYDASGYTSSDSYDSRTLVIDNEPSVTEITYPLLKTSMDFYIGEDDSRGETAGADSYNFDNSQYFRNGSFYIQGNVDDQYSPANVAITLTEYNEEKVETGKSLTVSFDSSQDLKVESNIEKHLLDVDISKKPTSLWNWSIYFNENAESENDIKTPCYYEVSVKVKDSAGNIESDKKGFFCVLPKTDYPYTIFPGYGQKIPVGTPLSGTSYDDDGIKSVKLSLCNSAGEVIDAKEDLYEQDVDGANIYTWKTDKSTPTTGGEYLLKVEVVDINGRASSYIVNESGEYLHSAEYREKMLTVVDLTAPSVEITAKKGKEETANGIDFDVYSDVVDSNGDFQVAVKVTDASQVRKVYMARVLNTVTADAVAKLSNVNPKTGNIDAWDLSANVAGIKFYNLYEYKAGDKVTAEVQANQAFNVFKDFDDEFATKRFYVYAENASGKTTVSSKLLLKEEDKPEIIVSEPLQGSTLTVPFNVVGLSVDDFTGIADLTIECAQNGKNDFKKLTLADFEELKKQEGNKIDIPSFSSDLFASKEGFESGSCTLTFSAKDKYGNVTIEKLQFYVEKANPFIKNVISEKNSATYKTGDVIKISLEINKDVYVSGGVPELTLDLGEGKTATAFYKKSDKNYLIFEYTVKDGDNCDLLNCTVLDFKGAIVEDSQKMPLDETSLLTQGSGALMTNATIRIDTVPPKISAVKSINPNDFYSVGEKIEIQMIFSENVTIDVPDGERLRLKLNITGKDCYADYVSEYDDIGKNKAMFVYTVAEGDNVGELAWTGWDVSDKVEITDSAVGAGDKGNKFEFTGNDAKDYKWSNKLVIDTVPAKIERIESSFINDDLSLGGCCETVDGEKYYYCNKGKLINLFVVFSESIKVSGEATLVLSSGSTATYSSGSGSKKLSFSYTVGVGDNTDGNLKVEGISGKIIDYADNETNEFPEGVGTIKETEDSPKDKNLIIDTTAPKAPIISIPATNIKDAAGIYAYTDMVNGKTKGVEVTGEISDEDVYSYCWTENKISENFEPYSSNEGIKKTFGNDENEGFYQEYAVSLKLKDKAGNVSADSEIRNFVIDTDKPRLTKASSSTVNKVDGSEKLETSTTGIYTAGEIINVSLVFNKNVTATGVKVRLNNGEEITIKDGVTAHIEGTDDYFLTGKYEVEQNKQYNEYLKIEEVTAGSVVDSLENKLDFNELNEMLNAAGFENIDAFQEIKIDSISPTIKSISSSNADGWYTAGKVIMINVEFSESVEFSGNNPKLKLTGGGEASYVSGSGTAAWIFNYTVEAGQNTGDSSKDTNYLKVDSILKVDPNEGKITDLAGVSVDGNSLDTTIPNDNFKDKKIGIDTIAPAELTLKGIYSDGNIEIKNGDNKSGNDGTAFVTVSCAGGDEQNAVFYVTKNGEVEQEWGSPFNSVQCQPNLGEVLNYTIVAVQRDPAGNVSPEASIEFTIDDSPIILERIETTIPSGTCTVGTTIPITLTFNKDIKVSTPITVTLNATRSALPIEVPIETSDTYVKEVTGYYDVQKGDITTEVLNVSKLEGVVEDRVPTSLNLGEVKDELTPLSTATNLAATKQITIDTDAPTLTSITTTVADGWYKADDVIVVILTFNEDVNVADGTELKMSSGGTAYYQSVKGQVVNFIYKVADADKVAAGDTTGRDKNLKVNGFTGMITDMAGNEWNKNIPNGANFAGKAIGIDTAINNNITIVNGEGNDPDGNSYLDNQTLTISGLTDDGSDVASTECIVNGKKEILSISNGTATITCNANPGVNTSFAVDIKMTDNAGNVAVKNISFRIDGENIELQSISTETASGTYKAGTVIPVTLTFNKAIKVTEEITVILNNDKELTIPTNDEYSTTLTKEYTVSIGDKGNSLDVKSIKGKVEDSRPKVLEFSDNLPTETTIADTRTINIDTEVPTVTGFSSTATADSWYNAGKMIQITMACSEIVNVADDAILSLSSGGVATYLSGSGSKNIVFVYNVAAGNSTGTSQSLKVTGVSGTIQDIAKNDLSSSLPSHNFPCGIDTAAPKKLTIGGITNRGTVTSCENLVISGFGETGGSGIFDYTISINGRNATIQNSVSDGVLTFSDLPQNVKTDLTVGVGSKQSFAISVYQTDIAGNSSPVSDTLEFTVDTNKTRLLAVKSSKSNETCTTGAVIDITLEFSRSTSGDISIALNNGGAVSGGNWSNNGLVYTATYKVENGQDVSPLKITGITGTVKDDLSTQEMTDLWSDDMNLSYYNVSIDTIAPSISNFVPNYNSSTGSATLTYTFDDNVSIVAGKKITLTREAYAAPIVLTPAQYNEYYTLNSGIKEYYEKTINGVDPSNKQKADLSPKYVLKYEYNPDNDALKNIFAGMGYYKQEIVMESFAVAVSGKVVTVTIPKENLMTGETYTVTTDTGIVRDIVGLTSGSIATKTFTTGNKPQPPVIRVNKISGRGETAKTTTVKIHTVTNGATVYYNCNSTGYDEAPETQYSESGYVTWREKTYYGVTIGSSASAGKYWITAKATKGKTDSDISYERAFKTVLKSTKDSGGGGMRAFRGGDVESGSNTISGFPVTWDEKSVPSGWKPSTTTIGNTLEEEFAEYGMLLAENNMAITWGVPEKIYFHGIYCKVHNNKLVWKWQMNEAKDADAGGEIKDDTNDFEYNYHDREGNNYTL